MKIFTTADGLPKNDIFDLKEDSKGRMWILCKASELVYIENDKVFHKKTQDKRYYFSDFGENDLGIYFCNSVAIYQEYKDSIIEIRLSDMNLKASSYTFYRDNERDTLEFVNFEKDRKTQIHSSIVVAFAQRLRHHIYHLGKDYGFFETDKNLFHFYDASNNRYFNKEIPLTKPRTTFTTKLRARNRHYDIVTNGELFKYDPLIDELERIIISTERFCKYPTSFVESRNLLVLSSLDNGVFVFTNNVNEISSLEISNISAYEIIRDSSLVIGTKSGDIMVLNKELRIIKNYRSKDFNLDPEILQIRSDVEDSVVYFLSNSEGLKASSFENLLNNFNAIPVLSDSQFSFSDFLFTGKDSILINIGESIDIRAIGGLNTRRHLKRMLSNVIRSNNDVSIVFVGSNKSFAEINLKTYESFTYKLDYNVFSIELMNENQLLFGTDGQGVFLYDRIVRNSKNILSKKSVNGIHSKLGKVLIATSTGAFSFDKNDIEKVSSFHDTNKGLWSNNVRFFDVFTNKYLFITQKGIQIMDTSAIKQSQNILLYIDHPILNYSDTLQLLNSREFNFQIKKIDYVAYPMDYYISFTSGKDDFEFISSSTSSYRNLQPGKYTLKVYGQNEDYNFKTDTIVKTIIVPPKVYETLGFKLGSALLILASIFVFFQYRFKKQKAAALAQLEIEKEYASIELQALQSQLNPHFVFNCLGSIQALISEKNTTDANLYLTKFSRLMRKFLEQSTIHTTTLAEEIEINKMYLDLEKLRFKEKLNYQINIDPFLDLKKIMIPAVLLQPYVENAIRHGLFHKAEDGNVAMNFKRQSRDLIIEIVDDGVGIDAANEINRTSRFHHESKGSKLMQRKTTLMSIVEELDFTIEIIDMKLEENISGTMVRITFPGILNKEELL